MRVYNYRVQEDGPRWTDTLDNENTNDFTYLVGQLSDSVIWGGNGKESFSFWKLGRKPVAMNMAIFKDGCNATFKQEKMRVWLNGTILLKGPLGAAGDSCQYAVLDTIAKTLTYKRLSDDLEWVKVCNDVRAWGKNVYCLYYEASSASVYLKIENKMKDSVLVDDQRWYSGVFFLGKMILVDGNLCEYKDAWVCYPRQGILKMGFHADNGIILQF